MKNLFTQELLERFGQQDLDWFFKVLPTDKVARYPLTNLGFDENGILHIEVAVAGFAKDDIELEQKGNKLHLIGTVQESESEIDYIQQHISSNSFERVIILHDDYVGGNVKASVIDGICKITVEPKENDNSIIDIK